MRIGIPIIFTSTDANSRMELSVNYQPRLLSLIKEGLSRVDPDFFAEMYKKTTVKNFAMSVAFPGGHYRDHKMVLGPSNSITIYYSTSDLATGMRYFNAFQKLSQDGVFQYNDFLKAIVGHPFDCRMTPIRKSQAIFKTMSPVIVIHKGQSLVLPNVERASYDDDRFTLYEETLRTSIKKHLTDESLKQAADQLHIMPLKTQNHLIKLFKNYYNAFTGYFALEGDPDLLNEIQASGLGSKRGCFAGLVDYYNV